MTSDITRPRRRRLSPRGRSSKPDDSFAPRRLLRPAVIILAGGYYYCGALYILSLGGGIGFFAVASATSLDAELHRRFADDLVSSLYGDGSDGDGGGVGNDFSSSWGVSMMLDLLYPGSTGSTREEMCSILGFPCVEQSSESESQLVWNDTSTTLSESYDGGCVTYQDEAQRECRRKRPTLEVANSVWIDTNTTLNPDYVDVVGPYLQRTNFASRDAGGIVNDWVSDSTRGLIDSVLDEGPIAHPLLAINAIYLNASWSDRFLPSNTNRDVFYASPERDETVFSDHPADDDAARTTHFMHKVKMMPYSHEAIPGHQVVKLDYYQSDLSMIVALPLPTEGAVEGEAVTNGNPVIAAPNSTALRLALPKLEMTRVALALPRFRYESKYERALASSIRSAGLTTPFSEGFCGIFASGGCLPLDLVLQKTFVDVHENGTEAAAVTVGGLRGGLFTPTDEPILFQADHPFHFYIYDSDHELVLFEGRVGAPEEKEGGEEAQLGDVHGNSEFWSTNFKVNPRSPPTLPAPAVISTPKTDTDAVDRDSLSQAAPASSSASSSRMASGFWVGLVGLLTGVSWWFLDH